jgi:O-antigen biosynthesis protein WbqP
MTKQCCNPAMFRVDPLRVLDVCFSGLGLVFISPLILLLVFSIALTGTPPLFRQVRVGRYQKPFTLIKLRTMQRYTASLATHLVDPTSITLLGHFLRRTKLDELPQLWNVLWGEMSLVGPRPCLLNQCDLILERTRHGVFNVRPGITGLSQLRRIDMSTPQLLAQTDAEMLCSLNLKKYCMYIFLTLLGRAYR